MALICLVFFSVFAFAQTNVLTQHNNLKRTGWNANETELTQANVSSGNFGKIFSRQVDDQIYAQPLVVSNMTIGGSKHNIVFVATVNNSVYAFDADDANKSNPYWQKNLTYNPSDYRPIRNTDMTGACVGNYQDFSGNMGIVCTPVIDTITNTIYILSRSASKSGSTFVQYLHALDLFTGAEKPGSPVYITATYPGTGSGNVGGVLTFDQQKQNPRAGLLLYNGLVYMCWASHCDWGNYKGWVMAYDATTLQQKYVYNSAPDGAQAGIWMSGQAPSVDDNGFIYLTTGNGTTGKNGNPNDIINRGSSLLKLSSASGKLKVVDFFTPMDYTYLNDMDLDYGIDGVLLIPNTNLSLSGSKESYLYLMDNNNMGGTTSDNSNVLQAINVSASSTDYMKHLHGSPVYFKDDKNHEYIYAWAEGGLLKQFPFDRTTMLFDTLNKKIGNTALPKGMPGAMLSLSSNGSGSGTGILWANHPIDGDANQAVVPGVLQAFDATDVSRELWNSNWSSKRDSIGKFAKFVCPTIANGKVYMATFSNTLNVYGLNPPQSSACINKLPQSWQSADIGYTKLAGDVCYDNGTYTITSSGNEMIGTADAFHSVYQPVLNDQSEITARVLSIENTHIWAKCGVMFRANLDPGSPNVFISISANNRASFQSRIFQSGTTKIVNKAPTSFPYWIKLRKSGNKYTGYISKDGIVWKATDSVIVALGSHPYMGLSYGSNNNTVLGTAVVDKVTISGGITDPPPPSACINKLPQPWQSADIGYTDPAGDACYDSGKYTITASGNEMIGNGDAFHSVYQPTIGDHSEITARVLSIQNTHIWAKCGVMFRANLEPGSPNVFISISANNRASFQSRLLQNGATKMANKAPTSFPYWVKIKKNGNQYTGYISKDGIVWKATDSVTADLGALPYIGLAYTSTNDTVLGTAVVDNVTVNAGQAPPSTCIVPQPWRSADIGYTDPAGNACYDSGKYTLTSSGNEMIGNADAFHSVYQPTIDDHSEITARIVSIQNTHIWAKCGVMFRANLEPGSPNVFISISANNRASFQSRLLQNGVTKIANKAPTTFPYWVKIKKNGNQYTGYTSKDGIVWKATDSVTADLGTLPYIGLAYTSNNATVLGTAIVDKVTVSVGGTPNPPPPSACLNTIPRPWQSVDIGYISPAGDACYDSGKYTITASGNEMIGNGDAFHSVYQPTIEDYSEITARVLSIQNTHIWAKCGVMFRANLEPGSPNVFISISANNRASFQSRLLQNGTTKMANKAPTSFSYWVKLKKNGNKYTGYISKDGITWNATDSVIADLGPLPYIGLAYTSNNDTVLGTAVVDNVTVTASQAPSVRLIDFQGTNIKNQYAQLKWSTDNELNSGRFEIERSSNTTDFEKIGSVNVGGLSSSPNEYLYHDMSPRNGTNFYRLKRIGMNGNFEYSSIATVQFNLRIIDIYPNPAHNHIYIVNNNNFTYGNKLLIQLSDVSGKVLYQQTSVTAGAEIITVNLSPTISTGMYVLMVTNYKGEKQARKIFIER